MNIKTIDEYENFVKESFNKFVLFDFYADWCGPCKSMLPILDELSKEYKDIVDIVKVNVDDLYSVADKLGIRGVPAIFVYRNGEIVNQSSGFQTKEQILEMLK